VIADDSPGGPEVVRDHVRGKTTPVDRYQLGRRLAAAMLPFRHLLQHEYGSSL
jgi:hypothetical protein